MPRICPRCKTSLDDKGKCPGCGFTSGRKTAIRSQPTGGWQQTAWGRTSIGLLVALGLFYGLMLLANAAILATNERAARDAWWGSLGGIAMLQVLLAGSLFMGGIVAGAGHWRGTLYGAIVGIYGGFVFLLIHVVILGHPTSAVWLFGLPILATTFGALGGFSATQIWKPIIPVTALRAAAPEPPTGGLGDFPAPPGPRKAAPLSGPINWFRVVTGAALATVVTTFANPIFRQIEAAGENPLDSQQILLFTFEISVLAMLLGGMVAGSNSERGIKQGLVMGILTSVALVVNTIWRGASDPAISLGFSLAGGTAGGHQPLLPMIISTVVMAVSLGLAGGWFGGQLMPPLARSRRERMLPTFR